MMLEYPFNMIPMDWPMLIFVEMLFLFYIFVNFIVVSVESNHENIYEAFDWYDEPGKAFGDVLLCMVGLALVFALFWAITQKLKLPRYHSKHEEDLGSLSSYRGSVALDDEDNVAADERISADTLAGINRSVSDTSNASNEYGNGSSSRLFKSSSNLGSSGVKAFGGRHERNSSLSFKGARSSYNPA